MTFEIKDKVALVTGGASGIGYSIVKALIQYGIKGVVIADVNEELGRMVTNELNSKFGSSKIVFQKTDVGKQEDFERAFEVAVKKFKHIDILFNNAGVLEENNWEKCVNANIKGAINGTLLATEKYLRNYKIGDEAVIVNTCSIAGLINIPAMPIYSATKAAIIKLTECYGHTYNYNLSRTKVIAICPGKTETPILDMKDFVRPEYKSVIDNMKENFDGQNPDFVANETMPLVQQAPTGSVWVIEEEKPAYRYIYADKDSFKNNML
ncbi:unnamed protein product [Phyllotreta striolata]|uniref:15-hydroxyprostaglandin dehydrogenase [NAD(+)]-like n=1 Tax=Phyllotreta striolata TaxID=444603 RepID=A0A9N9TPL9_PHYSR|nr:unnamed protein product [Phyllotreta striolata]